VVEQGRIEELTAARARVRIILDGGDQAAARGRLAGWPLRSDGPDALLVEGSRGREVNRALGSGGVWAHQITVERLGLEEAFLHSTDDGEGEARDAIAPR
jgi:ABC-2 type transport system ATP-binding protein